MSINSIIRTIARSKNTFGSLKNKQIAKWRVQTTPMRRLCSEQVTREATANVKEGKNKTQSWLSTLLAASSIGAGVAIYAAFREEEREVHETETIFNWSGTHKCNPKKLHQPENLEELQNIVQNANKDKRRLRPVGNALSPNGIALSDDEMISLSMMDQVLDIDIKNKQVTVQPGCSVGELCKKLREHGLVLQNLASIAEQQVGGFLQIGAHGTGASIPPVEEQIVKMKLVTPGEGLIEVSSTENSELFEMLKCGLGLFGVVCEVTLQCVNSHKLLERTFTLSADEIEQRHENLVREHRHIRYHWIPYTKEVVVTTCDPLSWRNRLQYFFGTQKYSEEERLKSLRELMARTTGKSPEELHGLNFADLRSQLLEKNALDVNFIKEVNAAEAEYWKRSSGFRIGYSDEILQFDCGGQQWVLEIAMPAGTLNKPSSEDISFMKTLLREIESNAIPAPAPIEQRWTSSSNSVLSPAASSGQSDIFSWIGIIMYLPLDDVSLREDITKSFSEYCSLFRCTFPNDKYQEHWAKIELPDNASETAKMMNRIQTRYPVESIKKVRNRLDPNNILGSEALDTILG